MNADPLESEVTRSIHVSSVPTRTSGRSSEFAYSDLFKDQEYEGDGMKASKLWKTCRDIGGCIGIAALLCLRSAIPGDAAESIIPVTPPGATDIDQALIPPPGIYGALISLPFNRNQNVYDASGAKLPAAATLKVNPIITAAALAYVYPFQVFGGSLLSVAVLPTESLRYNVGGALSGSAYAVGDVYMELAYWSKSLGLAGAIPGAAPIPYGLWIGGGLALVAPTGDYHPGRLLNIGANTWIPDPNVAFTYNTGPNLSFGDSSQISARFFLGLPFSNPATGYHSGDVFDIDWSATQLFGKFRVGIAGYYQTQVTNDVTGAGIVPPNGNRFSTSSIGPVAEYVFDNGVILKGKYERTVYVRNFVDEQYLSFSLLMKLK